MADNVVPLREPAPEIRVRKMLYDEFGRVVIDKPAPPGLLISLGDGRAVECTAEMLVKALQFADDAENAEATWEATAKDVVEHLIQQAQEKR